MTLKIIKDLIRYSTATAFVVPIEKGAYFTPVNPMLIAPPETGKTRILTGFFCKIAYETLDLSPKLITSKIVPQIQSGQIRFLVIPDLIQMLGHKATTVRSTMGFLNALIEEGVKDSDFYGLEFHLPEKINCGLITAVTTSEFYKQVYEWNSIGFLHRIIPISYDYSESKINEIHDLISSGKLFENINKIAVKNGVVKIDIPEKYADDIKLIVYRVRDRFSQFTVKTYKGSKNRNERKVFFDVKGFRLHDRFRQLTRAICYMDSKGKRKVVNAEDVNKLRTLTEVMNFPDTKLKI